MGDMQLANRNNSAHCSPLWLMFVVKHRSTLFARENVASSFQRIFLSSNVSHDE